MPPHTIQYHKMTKRLHLPAAGMRLITQTRPHQELPNADITVKDQVSGHSSGRTLKNIAKQINKPYRTATAHKLYRYPAHSPPAFTLIELLVVIAVISLLMSILMPALRKARSQTKRAICKSNARQLQLAWGMYADQNDDKIVSAGQNPVQPGEVPWCGTDWIFARDPTKKQEEIDAMKKGALYPYCTNIDVYLCPESKREMLRTYNIVNSMNGLWTGGDNGLTIKSRSAVTKPYERIVFIEEGWPTPDSFIVNYTHELWADKPTGPHDGGAIFSFVDGHTEYWKWEDERTLRICALTWLEWLVHLQVGNQDQADNEDLYRVQYATWGDTSYLAKLGKEPWYP